jgi:hypothetical protein
LPEVPTPDPELIGEAINGAVYDLPGGTTLVIGAVPDVLADLKPRLSGSLIARYAIPLFDPSTDAIIPGLIAGERGGFLVGREAWNYIQKHFQVHPRADVVGLYLDGSPAQHFLREIDLGATVRVLIYDSETAKVAVAEVEALVANGNELRPELLTKYLPLKDLDALLRLSD